MGPQYFPETPWSGRFGIKGDRQDMDITPDRPQSDPQAGPQAEPQAEPQERARSRTSRKTTATRSQSRKQKNRSKNRVNAASEEDSDFTRSKKQRTDQETMDVDIATSQQPRVELVRKVPPVHRTTQKTLEEESEDELSRAATITTDNYPNNATYQG